LAGAVLGWPETRRRQWVLYLINDGIEPGTVEDPPLIVKFDIMLKKTLASNAVSLSVPG
jgi:hypothetical protein